MTNLIFSGTGRIILFAVIKIRGIKNENERNMSLCLVNKRKRRLNKYYARIFIDMDDR